MVEYSKLYNIANALFLHTDQTYKRFGVNSKYVVTKLLESHRARTSRGMSLLQNTDIPLAFEGQARLFKKWQTLLFTS